MCSVIGKGDDRGRSIFIVIIVFAALGRLIPEFTGMERATVQTWLVIALAPIGIWYFWSLRTPRPTSPVDEGASTEAVEVSEAE
jgi:hypothetical protein